MPMTADQAKAAVTEAVLGGVGEMTASLYRDAESPETFTAKLAQLRQTEALAHRLIEQAFEEPKEEPKTTESDEEYRVRLLRSVGHGSIHFARAQTAQGGVLDEIGAFYAVKRK